MKSIDRKVLSGALKKEESKKALHEGAEVNPFEDPKAAAAQAEAEAAAATDSAKNQLESLEERKLRLGRRRDTLKEKQREEAEALARANAPLEVKRDEGDVFRNTQMKFNEKPEDKKMRLKRCMVALSGAGVGRPKFVGMEVGKPIHINWGEHEIDVGVVDGDDEDNISVHVQKAGKQIVDTEPF